MKHVRSLGLSTVAVGMVMITTALGQTPALATATIVQARYEMNEAAGATVMLDTGPNPVNGTIGSVVQTGVVVLGATGYRWSKVNPTAPPANPQRIIQVNNQALNPGTRDYAITIRYRSTFKFGNILQKGQAHVTGGYWKVEQPGGFVNCFFTGHGGKASFKSTVATNDGQWHVVRCERTVAGVTLTIDGTVIGQTLHATGSISNTSPLTIGGKLNCDNITITCDYFSGDIDYVIIETS